MFYFELLPLEIKVERAENLLYERTENTISFSA